MDIYLLLKPSPYPSIYPTHQPTQIADSPETPVTIIQSHLFRRLYDQRGHDLCFLVVLRSPQHLKSRRTSEMPANSLPHLSSPFHLQVLRLRDSNPNTPRSPMLLLCECLTLPCQLVPFTFFSKIRKCTITKLPKVACHQLAYTQKII